jgi:hypothetical protein
MMRGLGLANGGAADIRIEIMVTHPTGRTMGRCVRDLTLPVPPPADGGR